MADEPEAAASARTSGFADGVGQEGVDDVVLTEVGAHHFLVSGHPDWDGAVDHLNGTINIIIYTQ